MAQLAEVTGQLAAMRAEHDALLATLADNTAASSSLQSEYDGRLAKAKADLDSAWEDLKALQAAFVEEKRAKAGLSAQGARRPDGGDEADPEAYE